MQSKKRDANRYVRLTDAGLERLHVARRRYRLTVEDIARDRETPSINTIKRTLRKEPIFLSTLEKTWDYLRHCATERSETLPYLLEDEEYVFVESVLEVHEEQRSESRRGWISRQAPRPNRLFTGQREVLNNLHTALTEGSPNSVADPQAITGMGGIGKTQIATAYIYEHRNDYDHIFWVNAETVQTLNDGLASLAEELELLDAASRGQALTKIYDWFRTESNWLLVLDNADDIAAIASYLPRHHSGRLLLTTRARNTVRWAAPIPLQKLVPDEGALLLLRRAGRLGIRQVLAEATPEIAHAARELSEELGGLPLALGQAGAYLAETTGDITGYLTEYRRRGLDLLDGNDSGEGSEDHAPVTVTFRLALEQMAKRSTYGQAAVEMMHLCTFLEPDAIPEVIFAAPDYDEICAAVCAYSLVTRNPENRTLSIHRLVQQALQATLSSEERRTMAGKAVLSVSEATPDFEFEDWPLCEQLLPQWRLCLCHIRELGIETASAAYLLYQTGRYLRARAEYAESEVVLREAVVIAERVHRPIHTALADILDELACLYREIDRASEAEPLHLRSLEIVERVEGPNHPQMASKLHNMALFYSQQQNYPKSEALFLRSLAIREAYPGRDESLMAATLTQLAGVYRYQGILDKSERDFHRALDIYERVLPPDHIDIGKGSNNLGMLYVTIDRYEEAEPLLMRALHICEQAWGQKHPETGTVVWGLAWLRRKQRRPEEAESLYQRALHIYTESFGQDHSQVVRLRSHYEEFLKEQ